MRVAPHLLCMLGTRHSWQLFLLGRRRKPNPWIFHGQTVLQKIGLDPSEFTFWPHFEIPGYSIIFIWRSNLPETAGF